MTMETVPSPEPAGKPDIAATSLYPALARVTLFELHANLLHLMGKGLARVAGPRNIVIVGPGSEALPFSEHREEVTRLARGGNLILLDYNRQICDRLPSYLESRGFANGFRIVRCGEGETPDVANSRNTIFIMEWDLKNGFPLPNSTAHAVDMTLALHHITQYASDLEHLFRQVGEVLAPGGIVHVGEGNVDMKYSERKIRRLVDDLCSFGTGRVEVWDGRYGDDAPRNWRTGEGGGAMTVRITPRGMVTVEHGDGEVLAEFLAGRGYKQLHASGRMVVLPLIDHAMEEDFQGMIVPVRAFYATLTELCLKGIDAGLHGEVLRVVHKEQSDAQRGIVEYYSLPSVLCNALVEAGLSLDEFISTDIGPWVNILASRRGEKAC
jgi:SAM-dependent methyltransferase